MIDLPPDVPPQYAPIVITQASQAQKGAANTDRTIGVCQLIENQKASRNSAVNGFEPLGTAQVYLQDFEKRKINLDREGLARAIMAIKILSNPVHGTLEDTGAGSYQYIPTDPQYLGPDRATFLVEITGYKIKVVYFFNVMHGVGGGTEGSNPYDHPENCPNGELWKISFNAK